MNNRIQNLNDRVDGLRLKFDRMTKEEADLRADKEALLKHILTVRRVITNYEKYQTLNQDHEWYIRSDIECCKICGCIRSGTPVNEPCLGPTIWNA